MRLIFALFLAQIVLSTAFPTSNSLNAGSDRQKDLFRQEMAAAGLHKPGFHSVKVPAVPKEAVDDEPRDKKPLDESFDTIDGEEAATNKKFFADHFIHPSKLKHGSDKRGVVHVTVPENDEPTKKPHHHHHLHMSMPSKSKWAKMMASSGDDDRWLTTPTTPAPTTAAPTTTTKAAIDAKLIGSPSWLVDDWDDEDEDDGGDNNQPAVIHLPVEPLATHPPIPILPPVNTAAPAPAPLPQVPSISYEIHEVKPEHHHALGGHDLMLNVPATEQPPFTEKHPKHPFHNFLHHAAATTTMTTTEQPLVPPSHPLVFDNDEDLMKPGIFSKPAFKFSSSKMKLLHLGGDDDDNGDAIMAPPPAFPAIGADGLLRPDNDIADHVGIDDDSALGLGSHSGADVLSSAASSRHFPSVDPKHARIDETAPYFHSKTDYLEMSHAFHHPDIDPVSPPKLPMENADDLIQPVGLPALVDEPALEPTLMAAPGGDTFVLKIPEDGKAGIVAADLVPVIHTPEIKNSKAQHEIFEMKPEHVKPIHFMPTGAPHSRAEIPLPRKPMPEADAIFAAKSSTTMAPIVDEGDAAVGWSSWSLKVPCSRTCGMGIEIYGRTCQMAGGCGNASSIRYKSCGLNVCPTIVDPKAAPEDHVSSSTYSNLAYSSRHRQCTQFNNQPFDGLFYEWTPYYTTTGQCELFCLAKSANFYHKFGDQVEDGTACDPYTESAVCINGKCHPVGCDGIVGSRLKRDKCGICGGLNESCNTFDGVVLSGDFTLGYHDIIRLPAGATNIFVHEMAPSINNLALHLESGEYVLNGDYHIGLSKKVFAGNMLFIYTHNDKQEEALFAEGPLAEPVIVAMLYQSDHVNIHYEYSLPKPGFELPTTEQPIVAHYKEVSSVVVKAPNISKSYNWLAGEWSACSVTCGSGNRLRVVTCIDASSGNVVSDEFCPPSTRLENIESCHMQASCTVRWKVGEWSACSKSCGAGVQRRTVECVEFASANLPHVGIELCERLGQPKPPMEQACEGVRCDLAASQWLIGEWSACNSTCGDGFQVRSVTCSGALCDNATKPIVQRKCNGRPCSFMVDWIVSAWSPCVDSCGGGVSTRKVRCATPTGKTQPSTFCRFKPRPSHLRKCQPNENLCRPQWTVGNWSTCSAPCGTGVQTRSVICVHVQQEVPYALEDEYCHEVRPESEQVCNGTKCGYSWFIGPWTACSATCGTGHRSRTVLCLDAEGEQTELKNCPHETKPHMRQKCEAVIKHCSLKQQQEAAAGTSIGVSSVQQKAIHHIRGDCSNEDYGCCPDGITPALGPFNAGCPNTTCAESRYGCCPNSIVPALGPMGEGCPVALSGVDCSETMFGCCPDALTPAKGLDLRGCDGLCHDTRFGCCPDNIHPAAGVNFEGCPGLNCTESQFGCCPDGVRPAPGPEGKGCPDDGSDFVPTSASKSEHLRRVRPNANYALERHHWSTTIEASFPTTDSVEEYTTQRTEETTTESTTTTTTTEATTTTTEEPTTTTTTTEEMTTTTEEPYEEFTTEEPEEVTEEMTEEPEEVTEEPSTTPYNPKVNEHESYHIVEEVTTEQPEVEEESSNCDDSEYGCCSDGESFARGPNMEGCSSVDSGDCLTSSYGCCEDGVTSAQGPDGQGCSEHDRDHEDTNHVEEAMASGSEDFMPEVDEEKEELIETRAMPDDRVEVDNSLENGYLTSSSGYSSNEELITDQSYTTEQPQTIHIDISDEETDCKTEQYGCCSDGRTPAQGPNLEGCPINCTAPYESGDCETHELAWYYDAVHGVCARFWYSGCGGNTNRFATEEHCKAKCVQPSSGFERCLLPAIRGPCNRQSPNEWSYFDIETMSCKAFEYGGCNGNNNRFETLKDCEDGCLEVVKREVCSQPAVTGPCRANVRRWFFNKDSNRCETFTYGGCDGNYNRFSSADACHSACGGDRPEQIGHRHGSIVSAIKAMARTKHNRCAEAKETGPCKAHIKRWFFDSDTATCRQFVYGGCGANGNNFGSVSECQDACGGKAESKPKKEKPLRANHPACLLAPDPGPCNEHVSRYHYDAAKQSCVQFWFGGCGGNQNNFPEEHHCESVCKPDLSAEAAYEDEDEDYDDGDADGNVDQIDSQPAPEDSSSKIIQESVVSDTATSVPFEDDPLDCLEDFSYGDCSDHIEVWAFDQSAALCVRRDYSGCGGSANRFTSIEACQRACIQNVRGGRAQSSHRTTTQELVIDDGGSGGYVDEDRLQTSQEYVEQNEDSCNLPREVGTCSKSLLRFFYDAAADVCRPFFFTGCGGNTNNFANEADCMRLCIKDASKMKELREVEDCFQLPDQGPCDGQQLRWYFDFEHDRRCKTFYYGGCGGGKNNFIAHDDCTAFCSQAKCPSLDQCSLASTSGACPYGLLVDANGCELCQCHDPCLRTQCSVNEVCRVDARDGKYVGICEPEPESESCADSEYGCCPDGVTLSQTSDHSDCPEMAPEIITTGPTYIEVSIGETVTLQCRARGSPAPEIVWYKNWRHISYNAELSERLQKLPNGSLQIPDVVASDTGNYSCRAHNSVDNDEGQDAVSTRTYEVVVRVPAKIVSRHEENMVVKLGSTVVLPCEAEGSPKPEIVWYHDGEIINSDMPDVQKVSEGLQISPVESRHIGSYVCKAQNSNGQDERTIRVDMEASLRIHIAPHNGTFAVGSELTLTCEASGFPRPRLRWQKNGNHLKHATIVEQITEVGSIARLTIDALQMSDSGNYICTASNGHEEERQHTAVRVKQAENESSSCVDKPQFANCGLIVAARLCGHQAFAKFCCESCFKAGQLRQKLLS